MPGAEYGPGGGMGYLPPPTAPSTMSPQDQGAAIGSIFTSSPYGGAGDGSGMFNSQMAGQVTTPPVGGAAAVPQQMAPMTQGAMQQQASYPVFAPPPTDPSFQDFYQNRMGAGSYIPYTIGQKINNPSGTNVGLGAEYGPGGRGRGGEYGAGNVPDSYGFGNTIQIGDERYLYHRDPQALQAAAWGTPMGASNQNPAGLSAPNQSTENRVQQIIAAQNARLASQANAPAAPQLNAGLFNPRNDFYSSGSSGA